MATQSNIAYQFCKCHKIMCLILSFSYFRTEIDGGGGNSMGISDFRIYNSLNWPINTDCEIQIQKYIFLQSYSAFIMETLYFSLIWKDFFTTSNKCMVIDLKPVCNVKHIKLLNWLQKLATHVWRWWALPNRKSTGAILVSEHTHKCQAAVLGLPRLPNMFITVWVANSKASWKIREVVWKQLSLVS